MAQSIERVNKFIPGFEKHQINHYDFPSAEEHNKCLADETLNIFAKYNQRLDSVLKLSQPNLSFTIEEINLGEKYLSEIGISKEASFICFHNRDSAFLDNVQSNYDWSYHDYRDSSIEKYLKAAEEMIKRGYYSIRIGSITKEKINNKNPKLIDYANNGMRSDFLDIYLSYKCHFLLCSNTGISFPAEVFKKPIVFVNWTNPRTTPIYVRDGLVIFKKFYLKNENRYMSFPEMMNLDFGGNDTNDIFSNLGLELIENTPEEILAVTIEMDERLNGTWKTTKADEELQHHFWELYGPDKLKSSELRIGADYLKKNKDLLNLIALS